MNKRSLYNKEDLGKSFGLAVVVMLVGQLVLSLLFLPFANSDGALPDWAFWLMQGLYTLVIGCSAVIYAWLTKTNLLSATSANRPPKLAHAAWGCLAVVFLIALMMPINDAFILLIVKLGLPQPTVNLPMQIVPLVLVSCVLASVTEEILFRGTVTRTLADSKNRWATLAVCGALFAVYHINPAQTLHQFVLGAFLSLIVLRSGSVWTTVIVHFFNNLAAVILSFVITDEAFFLDRWYIFVPIGLVGFVGCVQGYLFTTKSSWGKDAQSQEAEEPLRDNRSTVYLTVAVAACALLWICSLVGRL